VLLAASVANATAYAEQPVARFEPARDGRSWRSARTHHADLHRLANGSWVGFVDGDRCGPRRRGEQCSAPPR
jgi:hypothetical protein